MSDSEDNKSAASFSDADERSQDASPRRNNDQDDEDDLGDDLFGDGDDDALEDEDDVPARKRHLDDEDLDSGDDEGRADRAGGAGEHSGDEGDTEGLKVAQIPVPRHAVPDPSDNELYLLKLPRFLSIDPSSYNHKDFKPPVTDHHSKTAPSPSFSAYNTALTTVRWRHSPSNPDELQSNARILRWSDGSLTLQFASEPSTQFEIDANALAPRQRNPPKPTPTSIRDKKGAQSYDPSQDSFTYLAAAYPSAGFVRVTNKITCGLSVLPSRDTADDALERLQSSIAAARQANVVDTVEAAAKVNLIADPELQKRQAEAAEREKMRAQRRMENALNKERERSSRVYGRSAYGRPGGLTIGDLEGDGRPRANRAKPRSRRRDYSDDEDDFGRARTKEDEYDEEDAFIAPSDEEEEIIDDDDEEELEEDLDDEPKEKQPKRAVEDKDADGEDDDDYATVAPRGKRRRVVDSDEEE